MTEKDVYILCGCEESQEVTKAFRALGFQAFSCDLQECSGGHPEWHIKGDVITAIVSKNWDLVIAHPPCTYLCNSGVRWLKGNPDRFEKMLSAVQLFINIEVHCTSRGIKCCIENPIPHKHAVNSFTGHRGIGRYTQIIKPSHFGHLEMKQTCLWLFGLPDLKPTNDVTKEMMKLPYAQRAKVHHAVPGPERTKLRSKTYPGIANAMANQWGEYLTRKLSK